jgi:hypothetical protein
LYVTDLARVDVEQPMVGDRDAVDRVGSELFTIVHKTGKEDPGTAA